MRTIQLTHEEIALILRALGIAEKKFFDIRKNYLENVVNVRGVENLSETRKESDPLFELENQFCDLLLSIKNGEKDV